METNEEQRRSRIQDLGDDVMMEILCSLPLNSITQCLDVCKWWRYLLTCSPFFRTNTVNVVVTSYSHCDKKYKWLERDQGGMQISELDFSIDLPWKRLYDHCILASCNGLLLSYYFLKGMADLDECYISNPWTKEFVRLPKPARLCYNSLCGLAFENNLINSNSMDNNNNNNVASYKIVMAYRHEVNCPTSYEFEIYSSDKRRWQLLNGPSEQHLCLGKLDQNGVYCNRVLYWLCYEKDHALMFNLETEASGYLVLPSNNEELQRYVARRLMECNGQLHYIQRSASRLRLSVWKMSTTTSSSGWLILHNVDLIGAVDRNFYLYPMWRKKQIFPVFKIIDMSCQGDDKVLLEDDFKQIVSYDLKRDVFELVLQSKHVHGAGGTSFDTLQLPSSSLERERDKATSYASRFRHIWLL